MYYCITTAVLLLYLCTCDLADCSQHRFHAALQRLGLGSLKQLECLPDTSHSSAASSDKLHIEALVVALHGDGARCSNRIASAQCGFYGCKVMRFLTFDSNYHVARLLIRKRCISGKCKRRTRG